MVYEYSGTQTPMKAWVHHVASRKVGWILDYPQCHPYKRNFLGMEVPAS